VPLRVLPVSSLSLLLPVLRFCHCLARSKHTEAATGYHQRQKLDYKTHLHAAMTPYYVGYWNYHAGRYPPYLLCCWQDVSMPRKSCTKRRRKGFTAA
jgi:hypothetical protein